MSFDPALSGSRVLTDEREARLAYPNVCWEHPQMYPGLMCPIWAIAWRDACNRIGLAGFGREALQYLKRLFPNPASEAQGAYAEGAAEKRALEQEQNGLQAIKAAIAVLDSYVGIVSEQGGSSGAALNAREAHAMKVLDVLEMGGLTYGKRTMKGPFRADVPKERREFVNAQAERDVARSKLLVAVRIPGRDVPRARAL